MGSRGSHKIIVLVPTLRPGRIGPETFRPHTHSLRRLGELIAREFPDHAHAARQHGRAEA
jgi:hypothetical protein